MVMQLLYLGIKLVILICFNPLNPTFPHLKALRPEIPSQKLKKKIIFFFFSFWDYESPAALTEYCIDKAS